MADKLKKQSVDALKEISTQMLQVLKDDGTDFDGYLSITVSKDGWVHISLFGAGGENYGERSLDGGKEWNGSWSY